MLPCVLRQNMAVPTFVTQGNYVYLCDVMTAQPVTRKPGSVVAVSPRNSRDYFQLLAFLWSTVARLHAEHKAAWVIE